MVRRSLIVAALLAVASPLAAQDEYAWTLNRPDADAPLGVTGARTLEAGAIEIMYRFTQMNSQGVWRGSDSLTLVQTLGEYAVAPLSMTKITHSVIFGYGATPNLTIMAQADFASYDREHLAVVGAGGSYYTTGTTEIGDITATAIYEVYRGGPYRMNVSLGGLIPLGKQRTWACTPFSDPVGMCQASNAPEEALPYDMRPGNGTFAVLPGISGQVQNEYGSLGAQFRAQFNLGEGPVEFTYGDRYRGDGWAAYKINNVVSVSGGVRWQSWGSIEGADPLLDPTQDPASSNIRLAGQRVDMPLGINFVVPGTGPVSGHRLFLEAVYALHHDYEGAQMGLDWGLNLGWKMGL